MYILFTMFLKKKNVDIELCGNILIVFIRLLMLKAEYDFIMDNGIYSRRRYEAMLPELNKLFKVMLEKYSEPIHLYNNIEMIKVVGNNHSALKWKASVLKSQEMWEIGSSWKEVKLITDIMSKKSMLIAPIFPTYRANIPTIYTTVGLDYARNYQTPITPFKAVFTRVPQIIQRIIYPNNFVINGSHVTNRVGLELANNFRTPVFVVRKPLIPFTVPQTHHRITYPKDVFVIEEPYVTKPKINTVGLELAKNFRTPVFVVREPNGTDYNKYLN